MFILDYYSELVVTCDFGPRWKCWYISVVSFLYIVYELLIGLSVATNSETDAVIRGTLVMQKSRRRKCDTGMRLLSGMRRRARV